MEKHRIEFAAITTVNYGGKKTLKPTTKSSTSFPYTISLASSLTASPLAPFLNLSP